MVGRREGPLDPAAGPTERFAYELRKLRQEAGTPTYRQMAKTVSLSAPALSTAAAGGKLPSLPVVLAYVRACGGDTEQLEHWERRWRAAAGEAAALPRPEETADPPTEGLPGTSRETGTGSSAGPN